MSKKTSIADSFASTFGESMAELGAKETIKILTSLIGVAALSTDGDDLNFSDENVTIKVKKNLHDNLDHKKH